LTTVGAVDKATQASYTLNIEATNSVSGVGKVALTVTIATTCSAAAQLAAFVAVLVISAGAPLFM